MHHSHDLNGIDSGAESEAARHAQGAPKREIDLLQLAFRYKWLLVLGLIGGLALGEAGYRKAGPAYEATAKVLVSKKVDVPLKNDETPRSFGARAEHIALIMSPLIIGQAVETRQLDQLPSMKGWDDIEQDILENLKVKRSAGGDNSFLNVLEIKYQNENRQDAGKIADAIVDAYSDYLEESRNRHTREILDLIRNANKDLSDQLAAKEKEYLEFRDRAPMIWRTAPGVEGGQGEATNVHRERLLAVEEERRRILVREAEIQSRIAVLQTAMAEGESAEELEVLVRGFLSRDTGATDATDTASQQEQTALDAQLVPLMLQEKKLERDFGQDHPDLVSVRSSIRTLLQFYRLKGLPLPEHPLSESVGGGKVDTVAVYLRYLRQQLRELELREKQLVEVAAEETRLAKSFGVYQLEDQSLTDEIVRIKGLWEAVVEQMNKVNLTKDSSGYTLQRIAPVRTELVIKRHIKFLGAGGMVGLLGVFGVVYLWTLQDTRLRSVDDVRSSVSLPLIGGIPTFCDDDAPPMYTSNGTLLAPGLCYFHRPGSQEAEAFRSVRTTLQAAIRLSDRKVFQVSSSIPGDGKSTVAANLAMAMAQSGKRVLLLDADMRKPMVQNLFGLDQSPGVAEILSGEVTFAQVARDVGVRGLTVVTAGTQPSNPSELLASSEFQSLIEDARAVFDIVLVDTPPLLLVSDPCVTAAQTDGLLLVTRLQKDKRHELQRSVELLDSHAINILGVVVNCLPVETHSSYGYGEHNSSPDPAADRARIRQRELMEANSAAQPAGTSETS